jgi:septal ring factor EnvC (AmiA/AmiB activator)
MTGEKEVFDEIMRQIEALAASRRAESDFRERAREELARAEILRQETEERLRHTRYQLEQTRKKLDEAEKNNAALKKQLNLVNFVPITEEEERLRLKKKVRRLLNSIDESLKRLDE